MNDRKNILTEYVDSVNSLPSIGRRSAMPVQPTVKQAPIIPVEKWSTDSGALVKKFHFRTIEQRNHFINELFNHETECGHHAALIVRENSVLVSLITKSCNAVTNVDREFAKACDSLYKCVTWSSAKFPEI